MGLFDVFKKKPNITISLKLPDSITTDDIELRVTISLASLKPQTISQVTARLRGDLTNRKQAPSAEAYKYLGETMHSSSFQLAPGTPHAIDVYVPLDFSSLNSYEIPPENLAAAPEEIKQAAAAVNNAVYAYSLEISAKTEAGKEVTSHAPIRVIDSNQIHAASF